MSHPFRDVAVVGVFNTPQARRLPGHDSSSIALEAALGALADAGIDAGDVDGVVGQAAADAVLELGLGPCVRRPNGLGIPSIVDAAALIDDGPVPRRAGPRRWRRAAQPRLRRPLDDAAQRARRWASVSSPRPSSR